MDTKHVRLALVILAVEDLARARDFYRNAFEWEQIVEALPAYVEFRVPGGLRLGLYRRDGFGINTGRTPSVTPPGELAPTELYFYPDDLAFAIRRLEEAGARPLSALARRDWGDEAAYFADLDGNVLVLARPLPDSAL